MMKRSLLCLLAAVALTVFAFSGMSYADEEKNYVEGEILVKFKKDVKEHTKQSKHKKHHAKRKRRFKKLDIEHVELSTGMRVEEAIAEYKADPDVEYAEPNYIVHTNQTFPDDPFFNELWGLYNTGQTGGTPGADIMAPEAWDITTGNGDGSIVVTVIDTGIDYTHEDIIDNLWINPGEIAGNGIDDDGNGYIDDIYGIDAINDDSDPFDDHGHGTHCAGTIGASGNNGIGVAGVNWNVKIMACKFLGSSGSGYISDAVECLNYVKTMKDSGVNIIATSNSWGGGGYSQAMYDALLVHMQSDILFVAAAGNSSSDNDIYENYPSNYGVPNVIAVAATDHNDALASFSSYGRHTVHVGAPGVYIFSTLPAANYWGISGGYGLLSGTSMATPHVAGLAGLIKAADPNRDWRSTRNLILSGGDTALSMDRITITGKRINSYGSLTCTDSPVFAVVTFPDALDFAPTNLAVLNINCEFPAGIVTAVTSDGQILELKDDGIEPDMAAGDGIYSITWTPTGSDPTIHVTFSNGVLTIDEQVSVNPLVITTDFLRHDPVNSNYSQTLSGTGGVPPYTWSIVGGALPDGLSLDASTGVISGIPSRAGGFDFTVMASDSFAVPTVATKELSIVIYNGDIMRYQWNRMDSSDSAWGIAVTYDSEGNVYAGGRTDYGAYFTIIKYDTSGNVLWRNDTGLNGSVYSIVVDAAGNVYATGFYLSGYDSYILTKKYDRDGNILWERTGSGGTGYTVALDSSGYIYVSASNSLIKYDPAGNIIWTKALAGYTGIRMIVDKDNIIHMVNIYGKIMRFNSAGEFLQTMDLPDLDDGHVDGMAFDFQGNIYVSITNTWGPWANLFQVAKYSPSGALFWKRTYDGGLYDIAYSIAVDANGNAFVTGESYQPDSYWGGTPGIYTIMYDTWGNELGAREYRGYISLAGDIAVDGKGNVYLVGTTMRHIETLKYSYFDISPVLLENGAAGVDYQQALSSIGGASPYTWTVTSGNLPSGLTLDGTTGEITGTPDTLGSFTFTVELTDADLLKTSRTYTIDVNEGIIMPSSLPTAFKGVQYSQSLSVMGWTSTWTWQVLSGSLPPGLNIDAETGVISGVPTVYGLFRFSVQATGADLVTLTREYNLTVKEPLTLYPVSSVLPSGIVSNTYSTVLEAVGGLPPYTWSLSSGSLPDGLSLDPDTGEISGNPAAIGIFEFIVQVVDADSEVISSQFSIDVHNTPVIHSSTWWAREQGKPTSWTHTASGDIPPYTWSIVSGSLGAGLSLDSATGTVSGTPTELGWHNYTLQVTDSIGLTDTEDFEFYVYEALNIQTTLLPYGVIGMPYHAALIAAGGTTPYTWSINSGGLPDGLILDTSTGEISGSPNETGVFSLTIAVIDAHYGIDSKVLTIVVYDEPFVIVTDTLVQGIAGLGYAEVLAVSGGVAPYAWTVSAGSLPAGLSLDGETGEISGVPTAAGSHDFTIRVLDAVGGYTDKAFVIDIYDPLIELDRYLPYGALGVPYDVELSVTGGNPPFTWSIAGGVLPQGIALDTGGGILAGTPTEIGIFPIAVEVMDGNGSTDTVDLVVGIFEELAVAHDLLQYDSGSYDYAQGVAADGWGNVYVAGMQYNGSDYDYVLVKYDASGGQVWKRTYDSGSYDYARDIALDTDGNIYLTGSSYNGADYDVNTIKCDQYGNIVWQATYDNGGQEFGYGVAVDPAGNVYVGGGEQNDFMTIKYDSAGTVVWKRTYDRGYENARDVAVDAGGNVYVTGESYQETATDYLTVKYDGDGNELWVRTYSGTVNDEDAAIGVALDAAGNVYVTGTLWGDTSLDYVTVKYDGDGTELWARRTDMGSNDFAQGIAVDSEGSVYVTGFSYNGMNNDYHTVKYDSTGEIVWMQRYDGGTHEYGRTIALDAMGYVYVSGDFNNDMHTVKYAQLSGHTDLVMGPVQAGLEGYEITISSRIANNGFNAAGGFYIAYYLSTDEVITQNDESVANLYVNGLEAGEDRVEQRTFQVGSGIRSGSYYIGAIADVYRYIEEEDETNNAAAGNRVTFTALPDLRINGQPVYTSYVVGAEYAMEYRVYNGSVQASGPFEAKLYLSTDSQVSGDDTEIGSCSVPGLLGSRDYICQVTATIPSLEAGSYYMITAADTGNSVTEINENNNSSWRSVSLTAGYPDLLVTTVSVEEQPIVLGKITQVDFAVLNQEGADLAGNSRVCFYISDDETITASDILVGSAWIGGLASGQQYMGSVGIWTPWDADTGTQYIGAIADCDGQVLESSESNNTLASAAMEFILLPDLRIYDLPRFTSYVIGEQYDLDIRIGNSSKGSAGSFDADLYLSPDSVCDNEDLYLSGCTVPSIGGWSENTCTITWTVPALEPGSYYICGIADDGNQVAEIYENNNTRVYWNIVEVTAGYADLVVSSLVPGETSVMGDHNMDVAFTVRNDGADTAGASNIGFYLSVDGVITTDDIDMYSEQSIPALQPGEEYTGVVSVWIPEDVVGGTYYLGAIADNEDWVRESDETNNAGVAGQIDVITMDLVITGLTGSVYRDELTVDVRVKNKGNTAIEASQTGVYLSDDTSLDIWSDIYVGEIATPALGPGEETSIAQVVFDLPGYLEAGTYYFGAIADHLDLIDESNNWNNSALGGEILFSPVDRPVNISPADGEVVNILTPTLTASDFVDVIRGGSHTSSQWQVCGRSDCTVDGLTAEISGVYRDVRKYTLPFTFPFFGRDITDICVSTQGHVELLESGEVCYTEYNGSIHAERRHVGVMDVIFAAKDDLNISDGYTRVYNRGNHVMVEWYAVADEDRYIAKHPLLFQVELQTDGTIRWNFDTMQFVNIYYDMYSGVYAKEEDTEIDAGYSINTQSSYVFDAQTHAVTEEPYLWDVPETAFLYDTGEIGDLTTYQVSTEAGLAFANTYHWRVRYKSNNNEWSAWSESTKMHVAEPLVITTGSLTSGILGTWYSQTPAASGGFAPYSWMVYSGSLPDGLTLDSVTGEIAGTLTVAGTFTFTIGVSDTIESFTTREYTVIVDYPDADDDGYRSDVDCNDNDDSVYPGAPETKHDGIDQDCNGYDLTIDITRAEYDPDRNRLDIRATSDYGSDAGLQVDGYGPMDWNADRNRWELRVYDVYSQPATVTVSGPEGSATATVEIDD